MNEKTAVALRPGQELQEGIRYQDILPLWLERFDSHHTKRTYDQAVRSFFDWLGRDQVNLITPQDLTEYRAALMSKHPRSTVAKKLTALRGFMELCFIGKATTINRDQLRYFAKSPKVDRATLDFEMLSAEEIQTLTVSFNRKTPEGARDYTMIALCLKLGLREGELAKIQIKDFITIKDDQRALRVKGKGDKKRTLNLQPDVWNIITKYMDHTGIKDRNAYLFKSRKGRRLTTRGIRHMVDTVTRRAGISKRTPPHTLRHICLTNMAMNGCPLLDLQTWAGHSDPKTTLRYIHLARDFQSTAGGFNTIRLN